MPTPTQARERIVPDPSFTSYIVNDIYFRDPRDHGRALARLAESAGDEERRLRGWMSRRGLWPAAGAGPAYVETDPARAALAETFGFVPTEPITAFADRIADMIVASRPTKGAAA